MIESHDYGTEEPRPAGPVGAGDPPPPPVAKASSGAVPPTPPPAGGAPDLAGPGGPAAGGEGAGPGAAAADGEGHGEQAVESDLEALLADAKKEKEEYLELAQRTKADFENYRKRMAAEVQAATARGKAEVAVGMIGVIDNLERALQAAGIDAGSEQGPRSRWRRGSCSPTASSARCSSAAGSRPSTRRARSSIPTCTRRSRPCPAEGAESGTVVEVMQKGYRFGEQLIRPARVVVSE